MFISYKFGNYLGFKDDKNIWDYELTDSKFETVSGIVNIKKEAAYVGLFVYAIIQEYSKRNLNVAKNLVLALDWWQKQYPYWSIQKSIDHNKKYNPLFQQYEEDLQKYLVLL
jgi:hypothetical protein